MKRPKDNTARTTGSNNWDNTPTPETMAQKGDLLIRDLWKNGTGSVYDMHVVNNDAKSHSVKSPEKCLQEAEREKKRMYLETCLQQHRHFSPFFASVDVLLGVEATATLKRIASRLSTKWRKNYYRTCGYVKIRIAITLVRAKNWCILGSVKSPEKCLQEAERVKKCMYLEACIQQRKHFYPFVALVDGFLGVEATATLKRIASRLATK